MLKVLLVGLIIGYVCYLFKLPAMSPAVREGVVGIAALYFGYFELPRIFAWIAKQIPNLLSFLH
jgi:XapX domain-containing protein